MKICIVGLKPVKIDTLVGGGTPFDFMPEGTVINARVIIGDIAIKMEIETSATIDNFNGAENFIKNLINSRGFDKPNKLTVNVSVDKGMMQKLIADELEKHSNNVLKALKEANAIYI